MGKMFSNMTTDTLEQAEDRLGGGYEAMPSGIYTGTIKLAYVGQAASSKATSINLVIDVNGKDLRETIWITNRDGENFYVDKNDSKKKHPLPGFTTVDDICLLATGEGLSEQDFEEKIVKQYDPTERKEMNKPAKVAVNLLGKEIKLGVIREINDKQKKDDSGKYVNTGETRTENTIDKVFHVETGRTVNEYRHEVETAEFLKAWDEKNTGKDRNKATGLGGGAGGGATGSGRPNPFGGGAAAGEPKKKMFGAK